MWIIEIKIVCGEWLSLKGIFPLNVSLSFCGTSSHTSYSEPRKMDLACRVRGARQGHCSDPGGQTTKDLSVPYLVGYSFTFSSSFFLVHVLVILLWCFSQHSQRSTWTLVKGRNGHFSHLKKKKKAKNSP